jgi:hypothetical protein
MPQVGRQLRIGFHQALQEATKTDEFRVEDRADGQRAGQVIGSGEVQRSGRLAKFRQTGNGAFSKRQQFAAVIGKRHAAGNTGEQLYIEGLLQRLDLQADRRLGHMEMLGGARQVSLTGNGNKSTKLGDLHGRCLLYCQRAQAHANGKELVRCTREDGTPA